MLRTSLQKLTLFCLLSLSCIGCIIPEAKDPTLLMHGDVSYQPQERTCVESSAETWRYQTNVLADVQVVWDFDSADPKSVHSLRNNHRILRWTSAHPIVQEMDGPGWNLLGLVNTLDGPEQNYSKPIEMSLVMDRLQDGHVCRLTAIHEFGHVLGVPHLENYVANIMYPSIHPARKDCLKREDLLMYCFVNHCGNVTMKVCEQDEEDFAAQIGSPPTGGSYVRAN